MSLVNLAQVKGTETLKNDVQKMLTSYDALKQTCEANKAYVDKKVADLVNGAPEQLDTLQELSKAISYYLSSYSSICYIHLFNN